MFYKKGMASSVGFRSEIVSHVLLFWLEIMYVFRELRESKKAFLFFHVQMKIREKKGLTKNMSRDKAPFTK